MEFYKEVCVRVNKGSGVILKLNSEFDYVVTAKHNLEGIEDIHEIDIWTNQNQEKIKFIALEMPIFHSEKDIAIIKIEVAQGYGNKSLILANTLLEKSTYNLLMCGFPGVERKKTDLSFGLQSLKIRSLFNLEEYQKLKFNIEGYLDFDRYTEGYSGSGVFEHIEDKVYLHGLFVSLPGDSHYGRSINCNLILELLKERELPLPLNVEKLFLDESLLVVKDIKKVIESLSIIEKPEYLDILEQLKEEIISSQNKLKNIYSSLFPSSKQINKELLKTFINFLFFVKLAEGEINIEENLSSFLINENNNWLFKSLKFEYGTEAILGELAELLYKNYRGKNGIIYIYDLINRDNPAFICAECNLGDEIHNLSEVHLDLLGIKEKSNSFLTLEKNYSDLKIECGDCFKVKSPKNGKEKIKYYNSI